MTSFNHISLSSLSKESVEMIQNHPQQFEQILGEFGYKSKKKRIRKKLMKMAVERLTGLQHVQEIPVTMTTVQPTKTKEKVVQVVQTAEKQTPKAVDVTETFDFNKLPVGFVLKVGKQFFANEQVFRFYYNQNHPDVYKNKTLLLEQFKTLVNEADGDVKDAIKPLLEKQLA